MKPVPVRLLGTHVVRDRAIGEIQRQGAAFPVDLDRDSRLLGMGVESGFQDRSFTIEPFIGSRFGEGFQTGDSRRDGQGVARHGSGLVSGSHRSHFLHDFPATSVGTDGQSASDDFPEGGQIGLHIIQGLNAAVVKPEKR